MMPFDIYGDSFGDPFMASPNPFMPRRQPLAQQTVLPEDESSLLGGMMEKGLGGLAYLGKILDKTFGGRAVRGGILGGNPRELLSVLPFSDSLGLTDERDVVHGKDLLTDAGLLTKGDDSWENIGAGVAADIALDPAIWFGAAVPRAVLGGLNAVGKPVLQGAGNLTQRATFGAINPYTAMQKVGDNASRVGSALFDTTVHGAWSKPVQDLSREVYDPALRAAQQSARNTMVNPLVDLSPYARQVGDEAIGRAGIQAAEGYTADALGRLVAAGLDPFDAMSVVSASRKFGDTVRATRQQEVARGIGTPDLLDVPTWMTEANERLVHAPARLANQEAARLQQIANRTGDPADIAAAQAAAANASRLNSLPEVFDTASAMPYFPRTQAQWADLGPRPASTGSAGGLTAVGGSAAQREDFLRGLPGGTEAINDLVRNPAMSGRARTMQDLAVEDDLLRRMTGFGSGARPAQFAGDDLAWAGARQQAKALSDWLRELPPQAQQAGMFTPDFVGAGFSRLNDSARMLASADAVSEGVVRFAKPIAQLEQEGVRYVRATDMLNNAGLTHVDPVTGKLVAHESVAQSLGLTNVNALRDVAVPLDVAEDMARLGRAYTTPGVLAPVVDAWDKVTNLFKTALTTVFPAFHSRNLMSGLFNQWRDGALSPTALGEAMAVIRGGSITPETATKVFPGLTTEQATTQLLKEAIANKVAFVRDSRQTSDVVGQLASRPGGMLPSQVPEVGGAVRPLSEDVGGFVEGFKGGGPRDTSWRDPLAIAGVKGDVDKFTPVVQGRKLGNTVEDFNRLSHYLSRRSMGDSPEVAATAVRKYQIDYSRATGFEQAVMKRLFPWYCMPIDHEILTREGFKFYNQIEAGEEVLGYDVDTGELKWTPLLEVAEFDFDGELMVYECRGARFEFTENHRWPTSRAIKKQGGRVYGGQRVLREAKDITTEDRIPLIGDFRGESSVLSPRHAAIFGWVITDGYMRWIGEHCEMLVYQSEKKKLDALKSLLGVEPRMASDDREHHKVFTFRVADADRDAILEHVHSKKDAPSVAAKLSRAAAEAMYQAMIDAEGSAASKTGQIHFAQSKKNWFVREAFQIVCMMTGRSAFQSGIGCYVRKTKSISPGTWKRPPVKYVGKIWCPRTATGTWVVRHAGAVAITGNTFSRGNLPPLLSDLATKPGKLAATMHVVTGSREPGEFVPPWVAEGAAMALGEGDGTKRFVSSFGLPVEDELVKTIGAVAQGDVSRTLQQAFGMAQPFVKLPAELATGTQMYSGRKLEDLRPYEFATLGGLVPQDVARQASQVIANTPLSRFGSTFDKFIDDRKDLGSTLVNTLFGARITDVEVDKVKERAAQEQLKKMLRGQPGVKTRDEVYVPQGQLQLLSQEDLMTYSLLKEIEARSQKRAREEKRSQGR